MAENEESFLKRLLATFKIEADEHLQTLSTQLLVLEQTRTGDEQAALIESLFREAHSLKGAARAVGQEDVEACCQSMESMLSSLKHGQMMLSAAVFDELHRGVNEVTRLLSAPALAPGETARKPAPAQPSPPKTPAAKRSPPPVAAAPAAPEVEAPPAPVPTPPPPKPAATPKAADDGKPAAPPSETLRISAARLGALMNLAEELLALKFGSSHLLGELTHLGNEIAAWRKDWNKLTRETRALRRGWQRADRQSPFQSGAPTSPSPQSTPYHDFARRQTQIDKLLEAMEQDDWRVKGIEEQALHLVATAQQENRAAAGRVDSLLDNMKQALMLPFSSLLELFPKLVRDQAKASGKEVALHISGAAIEIDRRILEHIKDPLIHMMRNAVDHGIEKAEERKRSGKPAQGNISIAVSAQEGSKIVLTISDDGGGIRLPQVRQAAERLGLPVPDNADNERANYDLLFESGLSTSPIITNISGRGLGLAIVREKVEKLGGQIEVSSPPQSGATFRIILPTTLATFRGLLIAVGDRQFVLPSVNVERVLRIEQTTISTVEGRETFEFAGQSVALAWLADVLGLPREPATQWLQVVVLSAAARHIAFVVDDIVGDQEVLVKSLGPQLVRVRNVSAATLLDAGRVVPILNVPDLLKSAIKLAPTQVADTEAAPATRRPLLVVEDSITSRSLLKNILESAGYDVTTAVDGIDALTSLRTGTFELVVSDVEMPRMDGFDLTARIRQEARLKELPVILVTALDSREDRERGIDVGASAYIVKSSFDQSNLLDVIRRLI
ncbi:hybrid sensor histidine kinase/response regulator [Andreprevotia chitinilytica]|uniref:hybrid sensor histidine kinase/response regulator n=1 Tax=Andreprevotia chitinilytica TaxID=396808 RepID=UPI0005547DC8|nr:response regulator [Andreprevotia chitinilytica]